VLKSLQAQSFQDFSITVVDSGSTDNTLEIISHYPEIQLIQISAEDFGYSSALNLGISHTSAEYIAVISGHSLPYSQYWLESAVNILDSEPTTAAVTGHYTDLPDAPIEKIIEGYFKQFTWKRIDQCKNMTNTNALFRRKLWEQYHFDASLPECEDYDWACEMLSRGLNVVLEPKFSVYHSHWHVPGSSTWEERMVIWTEINQQIDARRPGLI
jgi:rhamnosyltransferase